MQQLPPDDAQPAESAAVTLAAAPDLVLHEPLVVAPPDTPSVLAPGDMGMPFPVPASGFAGRGVGVGRWSRALERAALGLGVLAGGVLWALFLAAPGVIGPTAAPAADPGVAAAPLMGPTIGGPTEAFDAAFGAPTVVGNQARYQARMADGTRVLVCYCRAMPGTDGRPHAALLAVQPVPGSRLGADEAPGAVAALLLPPDASPVGQVRSDVGTLHLYRSAGLAATFGPSAFADATTGALVPPGTVSVACDAALGGCVVALGR